MRFALLALLLAGCPIDNSPLADGGAQAGDGGSLGSATLSGGPLAFAVTTAAEVHNIDPGSGALTGFSFVLTDHGLGCAELQALDGGAVPRAYQQVYGGVLRSQPGAGPDPGTYQVVAGATSPSQWVAFVYYNQHFPDGGQTAFQQAASGTVTLDVSSEAELRGSFQAVIPDSSGAQGPLQGSFDAVYCP